MLCLLALLLLVFSVMRDDRVFGGVPSFAFLFFSFSSPRVGPSLPRISLFLLLSCNAPPACSCPAFPGLFPPPHLRFCFCSRNNPTSSDLRRTNRLRLMLHEIMATRTAPRMTLVMVNGICLPPKSFSSRLLSHSARLWPGNERVWMARLCTPINVASIKLSRSKLATTAGRAQRVA